MLYNVNINTYTNKNHSYLHLWGGCQTDVRIGENETFCTGVTDRLNSHSWVDYNTLCA